MCLLYERQARRLQQYSIPFHLPGLFYDASDYYLGPKSLTGAEQREMLVTMMMTMTMLTTVLMMEHDDGYEQQNILGAICISRSVV